MKRDSCGCCETQIPTPLELYNRHGLPALAYRVGTFAAFRQAMLQGIAKETPLKDLSTRLNDDYAITLVEQWAVVLDILTFYQERAANEAFMRTARHRDSIRRLARLIDYHLRPGVAATAYLAFTVERKKNVQIPVGLRVQSVPGQDEKPQKFESLESLTADARLNRLRISPAPMGVNQLALGSTEAHLALGHKHLELARTLSRGDRVVVWDSQHLEELTIREVRVDEDRICIAWSGPIRGEWDVNFAHISKFSRKLRLFGYDAPQEYMEAVRDSTRHIVAWRQATSEPQYPSAAESEDALFLDRSYSDIEAGTRLLLHDPGDSDYKNRAVNVSEVTESNDTFGATSATVTVTKLGPPTSVSFSDRRQVVIYELAARPIVLSGYDYPRVLASSTLYLPGKKIGVDSIRVARTIERGEYTDGVTLQPKAVEIGRKVLLCADRITPVLARITDSSIVDAEPWFSASPTDRVTVRELGLGTNQVCVVTATRLPRALLTLTHETPQLMVNIGTVGMRTLRLTTRKTSAAGVAIELEAALRAADPDPAFSQARVFVVEPTHLVVIPGAAGMQATFSPTPQDELTVQEIGLDSETSYVRTGVATRALSSDLVLSSSAPEMAVRIGPIGPRTVRLEPRPTGLAEIRFRLQQALSEADPMPLFVQTCTMVLENRLVVLSGLFNAETPAYLRLEVESKTPFVLESRSAVMMGNVALGSHGETVTEEVVGDGDTAAEFQEFALRKKPLTFVPSADPGGVRSSLALAVNGARWNEVSSLYAQGPTAQVYTTRIDDEGITTVEFGDGKNGARVPSGRTNIKATYRQGSGLAGRVAADALRTLLDRPTGLKAVTNPDRTEGGADPESMDQARQNAPTTVRTFERAVSLQDFEDLVTTSGEVAKAKATWVWNGEARVIHLTVAGQQGDVFSDEALGRIHASLDRQRDPNHRLLLANFSRVAILVGARLRLDDAHVAEEVEASARSTLLDALSFEALNFGQPVHLSDIYRVLQEVTGVVAVDIERLHFKSRTPEYLAERGATTDAVQGHLRVYAARPSAAPVRFVAPAEQAWIEQPDRDIRLVTSGGLPS